MRRRFAGSCSMPHMRATPDRPESRGLDPALFLILGVALVLRVHEALRAPLWYDELYSLVAANRSFGDMLSIAR